MSKFIEVIELVPLVRAEGHMKKADELIETKRLININYIKRIHGNDSGCWVKFHDGERISITMPYKVLRQLLDVEKLVINNA